MKDYPSHEPTENKDVSEPTDSAASSFWKEIEKAWEWIVFLAKLLPRVGGLRTWIQTFFLIISVLLTRLLTQWGLIGPQR
jgi:hypothetical protein